MNILEQVEFLVGNEFVSESIPELDVTHEHLSKQTDVEMYSTNTIFLTEQSS